ncbi:BAG domain-containing protein Samui [Harpegnathos saltator]|uniref:BAG domain-containing protein Samui n=2 Tax=Harpegnathos saltator TaxID=610380 RepID=E2B483_HARSA|nr:BAG domain-containing protein Samui [Harpegnathos saltator]
MSFYSRNGSKFADRPRRKPRNELMQEMQQCLSEDSDTFLEDTGRTFRDSSDRHVPGFSKGFPFDDDEDSSYRRHRSDGIRAHLENLALRHPEFAEFLLGPPWNNAPFHDYSPLHDRRRRRGSGSSNSGQSSQGYQADEDTRSQTSSNSAASGASGASAVSSNSGEWNSSVPTSSISQYGLRNTVDIGQQQRRDMENPEKGAERGQRSMSAPPENRQQQQFEEQQQQRQSRKQYKHPHSPRFVTRVDITPQHNRKRSQSPKQPPPPSSSTPSNVRHIPIFVEGRDKPVLPKITDDDESSPPSFHQRQTSPPPPPQFHRSSHFNDHFTRQQWPPSHFQNTFYDQGFEQPMRRRDNQQQHSPHRQHHQHHQYHKHHQQPQYCDQQPQQTHYYNKQPQQQHYNQQPPQQAHNEQQQQQPLPQQQQETPKPKPPVPKDPLERVAQVQKEVDDLAEQVQRYVGGSRQDKKYVYLDEMLTRELIKLDDIETEGRENVRQARKNTIKSIQNTISLLETKAPLAGQQEQMCAEEECAAKDQQEGVPQTEFMEVDPKQEKQSNEPIPLPPAPSSPTKTKVESSDKEIGAATISEPANQSVMATKQDSERTEVTAEQKTEENRSAESTEAVVAPTATNESVRADETSENLSKSNDGENVERKNGDVTQMTEKSDSTTTTATTEATTVAAQQPQTVEEAKEDGKTAMDRQQLRLLKKTKKTKKQQQQQQPVSEQAIPLPPPPPPTESAK